TEPSAAAEADATVDATADADADAEPVAADAEPAAAPAADTRPETPAPVADAEPVAEADTAPAAQPEAEESAEPEPEPEPVAVAEPAQPEAETAAEVEPEPVAAQAEAPATGTSGTAEAPRTDLPPHLRDAYAAAGGVLRQVGLGEARARVYLVVDRSGSMRGYFKDGSVQRLAEQAVALAAHLDEDATVTTVFFSTDIDGVVDLTPADLTPTRVEEVNAGLGRLGRTNYHRAVEEVLAHHEKADPARPALVIFQTDGAPESRTAANQALAEAAGRPVHWRFTAWGEEDGKGFDYLRKLTADRTATHFAGPAPVGTPHAEFYEGVLTGLDL
ncbi:VWA domain-containing protein, partial [Streptomyces hydrogenans]